MRKEIDSEKHIGVPKLSRREVLFGLGVGLPLLIGNSVSFEATRQEQFADWNTRFYGFRPLAKSHFYELGSTYSEKMVPLSSEIELKKGALLYQASFSLDHDSPLFVSVTGEKFDPVFVQPLVAQVDKQEKFLVPVVHGKGNLPSSDIQIPTVSAGDRVLTLAETNATDFPNREKLKVVASIPQEGSFFAEMGKQSPILVIKNSQNPLDDIPFFAYSQIKQRDGQYLSHQVVGFANENGGTMSYNLYTRFQRTLDVEWMTEQLHGLDGKKVKSGIKYQGLDHKHKRFQGEFMDSHPLLRIASDNNNFDDDLNDSRFGLALPFSSSAHDRIYYSPKPRFHPDGESSWSLIEKYPQYQEWSLMELMLENCVDWVDPSTQEAVAKFEKIRPFIKGEFNDRGCNIQLSRDIFSE